MDTAGAVLVPGLGCVNRRTGYVEPGGRYFLCQWGGAVLVPGGDISSANGARSIVE